jgi:hypothetical protein
MIIPFVEVSGILALVRERCCRSAADPPGPGRELDDQLENTDELTASFQVGFVQDIVLVLTVVAATPAWP